MDSYVDGPIELRHGDWREAIGSELAGQCDLIIADPPYGQTSLKWDKWMAGWPTQVVAMAKANASLWCFGSLKVFMQHSSEFAEWKFAQDLVWRKQNGSGFHRDRFKRVHEQIVHFYRGKWRDVYHDVPVTIDSTARAVRRKHRPPHMGGIASSTYTSIDGGPRLQRSVLEVRNCHGYAIHPTQKPVELATMLIQCSCPPDGMVFVPFAGSGTDLLVARMLGVRAIGYEVDERYFAAAVTRLKADRHIGVMR